ncbi:phage/plasmid primase, P4 family [Paracoccus haematequi]|uniref:phage/plasmid primase, P4 family n=1 Tax=Paracoccus haematequi TaxID=2491866 RepID=UPI000F7EEBE0|nr:phage/plasmid primase, P4 family [Paracoccus haematequi]
MDLDNLAAMQNLQRAAAHNPAPWFAVQTSPGKAHVYWPLHGAERYRNNDTYRLLQRKLRQLFDGDKAVVDATRVLRVPGFYHRKGEPHLVTCYALPGFNQPVSRELLAISVAHVNAVDDGGGRHPLGDPELAAPSLEWLWYALETMPVDGMSHPDFISFTAAYKQAGWGIADPGELRDRWLQWCQRFGQASKGNDYNLKHWDSITDTEVGWKSLLRQNVALNAAFMFAASQYQIAPSNDVPFIEQLKTAAFSVADIDAGKALVPSIVHLSEPEQEVVLRIIADKTGTTLGVWKRTLKDVKQAELQTSTDKDHSIMAERILIEIGHENLTRVGKDYWKYNGAGLWQKVDDAQIRKVAQHVLKAGGNAVTQAKTTSIAGVLADMIHVDNHVFNAGPKGTVNCLNGELSCTGGMWFLNSHRREFYRTTQIPVHYDYSSPAPLQTLNYLRECFRDDSDAEQKIEMLFALAGYALMDHADHAKFLILKGNGRNGKSVWMHILESLVGEKNTANVQPSEFNNRFQLGELDNKLLNIVDDLPKKALLPDGVIKAIVSGGKITGEHKQRDPFSVSFRCFLTIGTNYDLPTVDDSTAMMERAVIIEWNRTFRADERDDTLRHRLVAQELPGILKYALDAYGRALLNGFPHVPSSDLAKEKWLGRINPVRRFVDQEYEYVPGEKVPFKHMWDAFKLWEQEERSKSIGRTRFAESLAAIPGVEKRNSAADQNQVMIFGLQRRSDVAAVPGQQPMPGTVVPFHIPGQMPSR